MTVNKMSCQIKELIREEHLIFLFGLINKMKFIIIKTF